MTTTRKRRRFQFGLRGLLVVVTLVGALLGWVAREWRIVHDRKAALSEFAMAITTHSPPPANFFWRRWLGDIKRYRIQLQPDATDDELAKVSGLFPEAIVFRGPR